MKFLDIINIYRHLGGSLFQHIVMGIYCFNIYQFKKDLSDLSEAFDDDPECKIIKV